MLFHSLLEGRRGLTKLQKQSIYIKNQIFQEIPGSKTIEISMSNNWAEILTGE